MVPGVAKILCCFNQFAAGEACFMGWCDLNPPPADCCVVGVIRRHEDGAVTEKVFMPFASELSPVQRHSWKQVLIDVRCAMYPGPALPIFKICDGAISTWVS